MDRLYRNRHKIPTLLLRSYSKLWPDHQQQTLHHSCGAASPTTAYLSMKLLPDTSSRDIAETHAVAVASSTLQEKVAPTAMTPPMPLCCRCMPPSLDAVTLYVTVRSTMTTESTAYTAPPLPVALTDCSVVLWMIRDVDTTSAMLPEYCDDVPSKTTSRNMTDPPMCTDHQKTRSEGD